MSDLAVVAPGDAVAFQLIASGGLTVSSSLEVPLLEGVHADPVTRGEPWHISWVAPDADGIRLTYWDNFDSEDGTGKRVLVCQVPASLGEVVVPVEITESFVGQTSELVSLFVSANRTIETENNTGALAGVRVSNVMLTYTDYTP